MTTKKKAETKPPAGWKFVEHEIDGVIGTKVFDAVTGLERTVHGKTLDEAHALAHSMETWVKNNITHDE